MSNSLEIHALAEQLGHVFMTHHLRCAVAESGTGGSLAAAITDIAGCSQWFDRGFVTYTNESKQQLLGVPTSIIHSQGAVSEAVVRAMAEGALACSAADVSVAISGIAGPSGGSPLKPVGTVWLAWTSRVETLTQHFVFVGNRVPIRQQAVKVALIGLIKLANGFELPN